MTHQIVTMWMWMTQATAQTPQEVVETASKIARPEAMSPLLIGIYVFALAVFVGFEIITKIPPTLHTPLMSGANAVSGITIVGALYCARTADMTTANILGFFAIAMAMINVVGGFMVTDRMLKMFKKKRR